MSGQSITAILPVPDRFQPLCEEIGAAMHRFRVPGVSVGVLFHDQEHASGFGVTSVDHPSPVTEETLFQIGSITKTVTATAAMRLVEMGALDLDAPVRKYLPSLRLSEEVATQRVTMRHLLTHIAGWVGDYSEDTGRGDDALAKYVNKMAELPQLTPVGEVFSYNNAGFNLAGRVIEVIAEKPYEAAVKELVFGPLRMDRSFFFADQVMVHSFAIGHNIVDGAPKVATPWTLLRSENPAGGLVSSVSDLLTYARFHMGGGIRQDAARILSPESLLLMQMPLVKGGEDVDWGLSWMIGTIGGLKLVSHTGTTNGQQCALHVVPDKRFVLAILANANSGIELHNEITTWALRHYLGIQRQQPELISRSEAELEGYVGRYLATMSIVELVIRDQSLQLGFAYTDNLPFDQRPPPVPPAPIGFYAADKLIVLDGRMKGLKAEFLRDELGNISWLRLGGRLRRPEWLT